MKEKTPKDLGFHMPAEWEKHEAVWFSWPYDKESFPEKVEKVEDAFSEIIKIISQSERVELLVVDEAMKKRAIKKLTERKCDLSAVNLHLKDYADVWFRDYGPMFIVNRNKKQTAMVDWDYNAYGKFPELLKDDKIPFQIKDFLKLSHHFKPGIVMEGGSIEVNGRGTLMTSEQCLLNKNRNPHLKKSDIEKYLSDYLGVSHFIWLKRGILGDHTDGHIDDFARFVDPTTVVYAWESDEADGNHEILKENLEILKNSTDQNGNNLNLISLPMPRIKDERGNKLPASYANFYIGNKTVLVPIFSQQNDSQALKILQAAFPERKVIGIDCSDLICGGGAIHCVSQQQPAL